MTSGNNSIALGKGLSATALKTIAIAAMTLDHIAWTFIPLASVPGFLSHLIGRTTIPIMCFFIAEGFDKTRDVKKYSIRLFIAAVVSHLPFYYHNYGTLPLTIPQFIQSFSYTSVMWPLFLGLASLIVLKKSGWNSILKVISMMVIFLLAMVGDWSVFAIMWILIFSYNKDNQKKQMVWYGFSTLFAIMYEPAYLILNGVPLRIWPFFQIGLLLAIPLLLCYNNQHGGNRLTKWFFYLFYPLHLIIISVIAYKIL